MEQTIMEQIANPELTLYGVGIESPAFIDLDEYENFPEDSICGEIGKRYYLNYEFIVPVEYFGEVAGNTDVFKVTSKNGEMTFYHLEEREGNVPRVFEGKVDDDHISWVDSELEFEDLRDAYEYFRGKGISFTKDYFQIADSFQKQREQNLLSSQESLDVIPKPIRKVINLISNQKRK